MPHGNIEFDPFSDTFFDDPSATYARLRDEAPVYCNETYRWTQFEVQHDGLRRVNIANVAGHSNVPVVP